jgi:hypothetical protein
MAREQNQLRLASPLETEPTFTMTLRGYNRREVDHYAHIAETQLHAAIVQRTICPSLASTRMPQLA